MLTLYDFMGSGNGYKVRLLLAQLGTPYKLVECDILKGETRTPEFLKKPHHDPHLAAETIFWLIRRHPVHRRQSSRRGWLARPDAAMMSSSSSHEPYVAVARSAAFLPC
jgi:glutathione S-transferase